MKKIFEGEGIELWRWGRIIMVRSEELPDVNLRTQKVEWKVLEKHDIPSHGMLGMNTPEQWENWRKGILKEEGAADSV